MRRQVLPVLTLVSAVLVASPGQAQTLSSRPAIFRDPLLSTDPSYGELVLGRTTLVSALRIFAGELEDSVRIPLRHSSNPDTLWTGVGAGPVPSAPRAHYRLDVGSGRYTLYFDKNERLVAAQAYWDRLPRLLRREDLVARYPTLQPRETGRDAQGPPVREDVIAPLAPCVAMVATIWQGDDGLRDARHMVPGTVLEFGYRFTCSTTPARQRAVLDPEP